MKLKEFLGKTLRDSGIDDPSSISRVEMLGDASRTPIFLETIKQVFEKDHLSRTLHSQEAHARGAALLAAKLNEKDKEERKLDKYAFENFTFE